MRTLAHKFWFWSWHGLLALALVWANQTWNWFELTTKAETWQVVGGLIAQISATMMAFSLALVAVLASIRSERLLRNLQRTGHFQILLSLLLITSLMFGTLTILGIAVAMKSEISRFLCLALIGVGIWAIFLLLDCMSKLWKIISNITPETTQLEPITRICSFCNSSNSA